jgi:UDP-N-acetylglucosamine--N-acetylmuramyl-(pentapeptide) pyrophosphoryl-undecaprenol N-acetylglucosamine transferase
VKHQAGERTLQTAQDAYAGSGIDVEVLPFIEDMAAVYAWADLIVCRAGALTVAEIEAAGLPAVFVPFPAAVDDHQTANAAAMQSAGAAIILNEKGLTADSLAATLAEWLKDRPSLSERAEKSRSLAKPDALRRITTVCLEAAGVAA